MKPKNGCTTKEAIQIGSEVAPGVRRAVRHHADHTVTAGTVKRMREGASITPGTELVSFVDDGQDGWHEVADSFRMPGNGPAQVATPVYRENYDRIFGKQKVGLA